MSAPATTTLAALLALATPAPSGDDAYRTLPLDALEFAEGEAPDLGATLGAWQLRAWPQPGVRVDGAGEAFLGIPYLDPWGEGDVRLGDLEVSVAASPDAELAGVLVLPRPDARGATRHRFRLPAAAAGSGARADFLENRFLHYAWLHHHDLPGAAWFRHQAATTRAALAELGVEVRFDPDDTLRGFRGRKHDLERTYELFTGGRACAENLALDEVVEPVGDDTHQVTVDSIEGITTGEIDWTARVAGLDPELDPLAGRIPHDQHALFFPTFAALLRVLDEARANGAPVLELLDASSEDALTQGRYERQLCLPLTATARILGGQVVESVAVTGGDPYLRTGSDVAVLFRATSPEALEAYVTEQHALAQAELGARPDSGATRAGGVAWRGVATDDRAVCSYLARIGRDVIVCNSLWQLERIAAVAAGDERALASLEEYVFFRDRYPRGEEEDAFLVLSDATIRRWCSPRWRIGASRRTRAAALLAEQRAADLAATLAGEAPPPGIVMASMPLAGAGALLRADDVLRSEVYGTDRFLTPIGELDLELVSRAEQAGYEQFRATYTRRWREVFDPIAARLVVRGGRLELDLSVVPLVVQTDYRELVDMTRGSALPPLAGDLHEGTLVHFAMAIGRESGYFRMLRDDFLGTMLPGLADPLGWLGDDLALYLDDDPALWAEVGAAEDPRRFLYEESFYRLPLALRISSTDPIRLAAFLSGFRSFVQGSAPGLVRFEQREHEGRGYVAVVPEDEIGGQPLRLYYVPLPDGLLLSLREDVIAAAIDRHTRRREGAGSDEAAAPWLGESAALRLGGDFHAFLAAAVGEQWHDDRQRLAWRSLPILDEWRRLAPDVDPVVFHAEQWGVVLACPGGAGFEWDEACGAMASATFGHPGAPRAADPLPGLVRAIDGASFGVTFEDDGLRARVVLER